MVLEWAVLGLAYGALALIGWCLWAWWQLREPPQPPPPRDEVPDTVPPEWKERYAPNRNR